MFSSIRDIRELHARRLKPLLAKPDDRAAVLRAADEVTQEQRAALSRDAVETALGQFLDERFGKR